MPHHLEDAGVLLSREDGDLRRLPARPIHGTPAQPTLWLVGPLRLPTSIRSPASAPDRRIRGGISRCWPGGAGRCGGRQLEWPWRPRLAPAHARRAVTALPLAPWALFCILALNLGLATRRYPAPPNNPGSAVLCSITDIPRIACTSLGPSSVNPTLCPLHTTALPAIDSPPAYVTHKASATTSN
jgi:hypothetical protein